MNSPTSIAFVWDNFGPIHVDRIDAVASFFEGTRRVIGLEICGESNVYDWTSETGRTFQKFTLFPEKKFGNIGTLELARKIVSSCIRERARDIFFCHYDHPAIFVAASALRAIGRGVFAMGCSKFDDYERSLPRELAKSLFYLPYGGGISSGKRARDYMRFLGVPEKNIATEYNTLSIERIRRLAGTEPAPDGAPFSSRHFTIVARFVPKKNIAMAIEAYARYLSLTESPHPLHLCGSGPLEAELRAQVQRLDLANRVEFHGFLQTDQIAKILGSTLALLLPSTEEQFGNVVIEAQALGVPVILSDNCGARDALVRSGVNGFVVEPDNPKGLAYFMHQISRNEAKWRDFAAEALSSGPRGDVRQFATAVARLLDVKA